MLIRVEVWLDSDDPQQAALLRRVLGVALPQVPPVSRDFVRVVAKSKTGREVFVPLIRAMVAGQSYSAKELADLLGTSAVIVGHRISAVGRTERKYNTTLFERVGSGKSKAYVVSAAMKAAFA